MRVFISWSGDRSRRLAESIRGWLPHVLQNVETYFSPDDIDKGSRWSASLAQELEACQVGLICLTRENLEAPWIMFEAGALAKRFDVSRVCPLLFGVRPADLKGPLAQFQCSAFDKAEMEAVVRTINSALGSSGLKEEILHRTCDRWWRDLELPVRAILDEPVHDTPSRLDRDIVEEILDRVRSLPRHSVIRLDTPPLEDLTALARTLRTLVEDLLESREAPWPRLHHEMSAVVSGLIEILCHHQRFDARIADILAIARGAAEALKEAACTEIDPVVREHWQDEDGSGA